MKRGCLFSLLIFAVCTGVLYLVYHERFTPPGDRIGALVAGFLSSMSIGMFRTARHAKREARLIDDALRGVNPADGELSAIAGTIRPTGKPLVSPVSGRECVLYDYEIFHTVPRKNSTPDKVMDYSGFALGPTVIDSPHGEIALLGFPLLEDFDKHQAPMHEYDGVRRYIHRTEFADLKGLNVLKGFAEVKDALNDSDGVIRKDYQMKSDVDLHKCAIEETVVPPGERVCVIGTYSAQQNAIVPAIAKGNAIRLIRGTPEEAMKSLQAKAWIYNFGGGLLLIATNAVTWFLLHLREGSLQ